MKIKLNKVEFEILPVDAATRAAVLSDPNVQQGVRRKVWSWDKDTGKGTMLSPVTKAGAIPLPNGLIFFVPKTGETGIPARNDGPTQRMGERFLEAVGAKAVPDVLRALSNIFPLPQKKLPREAFKALSDTMSFTIVAETDHAVVQLKDAGRNLSAFVFLPAVVAFRPAVAEDQKEAFDAFLKDHEDFVQTLPAFVLPAGTEPAKNVRRLALAQRMQETKSALDRAADEKAEAALKRIMSRLSAEARALQPTAQTRTA